MGIFIFHYSTKKIISPGATFGRGAKSASLLLSSDSGRVAMFLHPLRSEIPF